MAREPVTSWRRFGPSLSAAAIEVATEKYRKPFRFSRREGRGVREGKGEEGRRGGGMEGKKEEGRE